MRQVLMDSQGAFIARVPRPSLQPGTVLVQVRYSMISTGTETAGLRAALQPTTDAQSTIPLLAKARQTAQVSATAFRYLRKAIGNPNLARQRLKLIAKQKLFQFKSLSGPDNKVSLDETFAIGWNIGYSAMGEVIGLGEGIDDLSLGDLVACAGASKANHADTICVPRN